VRRDPGLELVISETMRAHQIPVVLPFRLDLTARVLRRLSTNNVDVLTPSGVYMRALSGVSEPVIVRVTQHSYGDALAVEIDGDTGDDGAVLDLIRETLGADRELTPFYRAAARIPWLAPLVKRMRGVKPPRYPSLWEACANAVVFQQLSLNAASTIMRRLIVAVGRSVSTRDLPVPLYVFPTAESFDRTSDERLRATGLSANKIATLRRVCYALLSGILDPTGLERCPSAEAATMLRRIKGIGPWTAAVILLRGLGRLDVFPANDSGVAASMSLVAGSARSDVEFVLNALGPQRGMLYFHLLLARLEASGEVSNASQPTVQTLGGFAKR
jgi:DNA-3-methyladenine glycosylase II